MRGLGKCFHDSPKANGSMSDFPDPRVEARHYHRRLPQYGVVVDEPWWWALLALGADCINVHTASEHRGPLAIISRGQKELDRRRDEDALAAILKGQGRPTFDALRCPRAAGRIVGLVDVVDCMDDERAEGLWFVGPYGLKVEHQCLLPIGPAGVEIDVRTWGGGGLVALTPHARDSIHYGILGLVNGYLEPGKSSR